MELSDLLHGICYLMKMYRIVGNYGPIFVLKNKILEVIYYEY